MAHFDLQRDLPYQSRFQTIAGQRLHYLDEGTGPAVLLLHGNPTWCFYYRGLIDALRSQFRVIAPDYVGCGLSDQPVNIRYRAVERADHIEELIKQLGVKRYSLVMHDWGGPIGTQVAVRDVSRVEKLVYLNTTLTETESLPAVIRTAASPLIGKALTMYTMRFLKLMTDFGVCKKLPQEVKEGYYYPYRSIAQRKAIWDFVADIPFDSSHPSYRAMLDLGAKLPELSKVPVQIIWGLRDPCFHREMLTKVARHFPQARVLEIPQASHLVLEDAPELVHGTIREFLGAEQGADSGPKKPTPTKQDVTETPPAQAEHSLFAAFSQMAVEYSQREAVVVPEFRGSSVRYAKVNFGDLALQVNQYQRGLRELGLTKGDKVLMLVPPGIEFLALALAVMGRGGVPIFIDPGMGRQNLLRCVRDGAPDALIGSPRAHLLRLFGRGIFSRLRFHLSTSEWIFTGGPNISFLKKFSTSPLEPVSPTETALIAFTSGATGTPKGAIFTQEMLKAQLRLFREHFLLAPGRIDLPLLPIFSLFNVALGRSSVVAPIDPAQPLSLEPQKIIRLILDLNIESSFGSPTLWNKIAEYCVRSGEQLASLEAVFMAGAPVAEGTLRRVQKILPNGRACTPYGATEALPVTFASAAELLGGEPYRATSGELGTLVGRPVPGIEVKIIRAVDGTIDTWTQVEELQPGDIGEVIVRGPTVSSAYLNRPDANRANKIKVGETIWHRMGDMGYLDSSGKLYFCGRKAHTVQTVARSYYPIPTERVFNEHPRVRRSALVGLHGGREPAIVVEPDSEFWTLPEVERANLVSELRGLAKGSDLTSRIERFFFHKSFPVDRRHNAKIFRDQLARWADTQANT